MPRRSRPLMIAPFIPLLGIVGVFGLQYLHDSKYLPAFIVAWCLALAALFVYVLNRALEARKRRT